MSVREKKEVAVSEGSNYILFGRNNKPKVEKAKKQNFTRKGLTDEEKKGLTYEQFVPLYEMWKEYFRELVGDLSKLPDDRMLKADYHGALVLVSEADNATQVGTVGIIALETRYTFQLITKQDRYVVIPKQGTSFQFALDGRVFILFGDALRYKPSLRGKKQRQRTTVPYFLR